MVPTRAQAFAAAYQTAYPAAVRALLADRQALTVYLRFRREHWRRIRHSNFIERTFGETRRGSRSSAGSQGETSCMSLVWAVLDRASRGWRGFTITTTGTRQLQDLRRQLLDPPTPIRRHTKPIHSPPPTRHYINHHGATLRRHLHRSWDATVRYARMVYGKAVPSKSSIMEPGTGPELLAHGVGWRIPIR